MPFEERADLEVPTTDEKDRWKLPPRIQPQDMIESVAVDSPPSIPESAGDPDTAWMLRYSG